MAFIKHIDSSVYREGDKVVLDGDDFCQRCGTRLIFKGKAKPILYDTKTGEAEKPYAEGHFECPNHPWWWPFPHTWYDGEGGIM